MSPKFQRPSKGDPHIFDQNLKTETETGNLRQTINRTKVHVDFQANPVLVSSSKV